MTCHHCDIAAKRRHHGFTPGCRGCAARSLVRSPHWRRVQQAGVQDRQYRAALQQMGVTHLDVCVAAGADVASKETKCR